MVRAALTERNDVVDFHSRVGTAACCADFGGTNSLHVIGCDLSYRNLANAPIVSRSIVDLFCPFRILLAPLAPLLIQPLSVALSVSTTNFAVMIWVLGFGVFRCLDVFSRVLAIRTLLLLTKYLWIFFAQSPSFLILLGLGGRPILTAIFNKLVVVLRAPSRLVLAITFFVRRRPQLRASPRFDFSFFGFIHRPMVPHFGAANNYAV